MNLKIKRCEKDNLNEKEKAIMRTVVAKLTGENNGKKII